MNPFFYSWTELEKQFEKNKVDIIPHSSNLKKEEHKKIYTFSGDQVYIAAYKNNRDILDQMDKIIKEMSN